MSGGRLLPQPPIDQVEVVKLANDVMSEHGAAAASYVCDRIIEHMGGDPAVEDLWHAVLELVCLREEAEAKRAVNRNSTDAVH